ALGSPPPRRRPPAGEGLRPLAGARRVERGLREPDQALAARLPRGLLLKAEGRLGAARPPLAGPDRPLRVPLRARLEGARGESPAGRRRRPRPARPDLRAGPALRPEPEPPSRATRSDPSANPPAR